MLTPPHTPANAAPHRPNRPNPGTVPSAPTNTAMPNFIIVGATKAGTTSLYHYLKQHPDVYMPAIKEPKFFKVEEGTIPRENGPQGWREGARHVRTLEMYQGLFQNAQNERARGEASPQYLYFPDVPPRIHKHVPDADIIAVLRNPVDRAFSAFCHLIRDGNEIHTDFAAALQDEPERIRDGWSPLYHFRAQGFYYEQLRRYFDLFGAAKVHVYLYDDLQNDPAALTRNIFAALGVDETFTPNFETQHNISGVPEGKMRHQLHEIVRASSQSLIKVWSKKLLPKTARSKIRTRALKTLQSGNLEKPTCPPEIRAELIEAYRDDIGKLQGLIGRDLSHWLQ